MTEPLEYIWKGKGEPGQDLVMVGYAALSGSVDAIETEREILLGRLPEELLQDTMDQFKKMAGADTVQIFRSVESDKEIKSTGVSACYSMGIGGILSSLWYVAQQWNVGFTIQLKDIPVRQETIEICEILGINPYRVWSEHCLLVAADHGHRLCDILKKRGITAKVIGNLNKTKDHILTHDDTVSYLNRPEMDELSAYMEAKYGKK